MKTEISEVQKARWSLIHQTFDKVYNVPSYRDFRSNTFCVIAYLGLQMIAKKEGLLDGEEWYDPECRDELLGKVKAFLIKYIK